MTRRDYELLGDALRGSLILAGGRHAPYFVAQHALCCERVAEAIFNLNPSFDKERFIKDCKPVEGAQ